MNPEERVRACLSCGAIVEFGRDACPDCGTRFEAEAREEDRVKLCLVCSRVLNYQQTYCGQCGSLAVPFGGSDGPPAPPAPARPALRERLPELVGVGALVAGFGALAAAAVVLLS